MATIQRLLLLLLSIALWNGALVQSQRRGRQRVRSNMAHQRHLEAGHYHTLTTTELGLPNPEAAIGNPLKGLLPSPQYSRPPYTPNLPHSLEFFYIGLKQVMVGDPDILGEMGAFDWTTVEKILAGTTSRSTHAILRFYVVYPGRQLEVPQYLIDAGIELRNYTEDNWVNEQSPYFDNAILLKGLEQFVRAFGRKYDGDVRIGYIQAGLLGFWGEWHSMGKGFLPNHVEDLAVGWFARSFFRTEVQFRYPSAAVRNSGFGLHDDSFAYETLDGPDNGGYFRSYYFYQRILREGMVDAWKTSAVGGEVRGELAHEIFEPTYNANTWQKQDFVRCVNVTRSTYQFMHGAFETPFLIGTELANARFAHSRMGYNFHVPSVSVRNSTLNGQVDVSINVTQIGVAPYYYDLGLAIQCPGMTKKTLSGVETLIEQGATKVFVFTGIPATSACMRAMALSLESSYVLSGRPIKFAQGSGSLAFSLPLPGDATHAPTLSPTQAPTLTPLSLAPTYGELDATKLTLINADTDLDVVRMRNRMIINLFQHRNLNVRADPVSTFKTRSVEFKLDGSVFRIENGAPYALNGNAGPNYFAWTPLLGDRTLEVTPFSNTSATGIAGAKVAIKFTVIDVTITKAPVTARPTIAPVTKRPTNGPITMAPISSRPTLAPKTVSPPTKGPLTTRPTTAPVTGRPTKAPTTTAPTKAPVTSKPTEAPVTASPTFSPLSSRPTKAPITPSPTKGPATQIPTQGPVSKTPTNAPITSRPTKAPVTASPTTDKPTGAPLTTSPTLAPITARPTRAPITATPTKAPITSKPTHAPLTASPTLAPKSSVPTKTPTSASPTKGPVTQQPTQAPMSKFPTNAPITTRPTKAPTTVPPTKAPITSKPTAMPTLVPISSRPTLAPLSTPPTRAPVTSQPIKPPTKAPTTRGPSIAPVKHPTKSPIRFLTKVPFRAPTKQPTKTPLRAPTKVPLRPPTKAPVRPPTKAPVRPPTKAPLRPPTKAPVRTPTKTPVRPPTKPPTRAPSRATPAALPSVVNLSLFNADTDRRLLSLTNGVRLSRSALKTRNYSIEASVTHSHTVGSVRFAVNDNPNFFTESQAPYTIAGDNSRGNYYAWTPTLGNYTVTVTPFTLSGQKGNARTVTFTVEQ